VLPRRDRGRAGADLVISTLRRLAHRRDFVEFRSQVDGGDVGIGPQDV
jgi:hypothetical protein